MNPLVKKILIVIGVVLVIGALVFVLFFYKGTLVFNPNPASARIDVNGQSITGANKIKLNPGSYQVKITAPGYVDYIKSIEIKTAKSFNLTVNLKKLPEPEKISESSAQYLSSGQDLKTLFYLGNNGKTIYMVKNAESNEIRKIEPITPDVFNNIKNLILSPDQYLAIYKKDLDTFLYDFKRYDLLHQEIYNLGKNIGSIVWSPDNTKIAYYFQTPEVEKTLIRANKDNTGQERIYNFKDTDITNPELDWSKDSQKILLVKDNLYVFDIYSKTLTQITSDRKIIAAKFAPDSKNIVFNQVDDKQNISICLIDLEGKNVRELSFKTTLDKIAWLDDNNMIAALPNLTDSNASDKLVKLNTENFEETNYGFSTNTLKITPTNLVVLEGKQKIFFLNNSNLYELDLISTDY